MDGQKGLLLAYTRLKRTDNLQAETRKTKILRLHICYDLTSYMSNEYKLFIVVKRPFRGLTLHFFSSSRLEETYGIQLAAENVFQK